MKFAYIEAEKANFSVVVLCKVLRVSRAGFYAWRNRPVARRRQQDAELAEVVASIHQASRRTYGSPRVHAELSAQGVRVGRKRVARLMRHQGLVARTRRRFRTSPAEGSSAPPAANVLERAFVRKGPNEAWVGDITYLWTSEGWLYLAVLLDLYSRRVVGWAMSDRVDRLLALSALEMAISNRSPKALLHHTDRGSQYTSTDYRQALERHGLTCSMSRVGNCWDNAVAESFFATLKTELLPERPFPTRQAAKQAVFEYIEVFYNRQRRHSALGYLTPAGFEDQSPANLPVSA